MTVQYASVVRHTTELKDSGRQGRVVLSRLQRGDSPVFCATPCIKFVLEGEERYEVGGVTYVVLPGDFLVVDAGTQLRAVLPSRSTTTGMCIYLPAIESIPYIPLDLPEDDQAPPDCSFRTPAVVQSGRTTRFGQMIVQSAKALSRSSPEGRQEVATEVARRAAGQFDGFAVELSQQLANLDVARPSTRSELLRRVDAARGYLHEHADRSVSLSELSRAVGMSQFHLARSFRAVYGLPPSEYHRGLRLDAAARQIGTGESTASAAALASGFSDLSSFSRAFKRRHGISPGRAGQLF